MSEMQAEAVEPVYCEGIQLLLQRMESHPKEFEIDSGKWGATMRVVYERVMGKSKTNNVIPEPWLTQEEVYVVWCKYKQIKQQEFHEFVMKKLFGEEKDDRMDAYAISQGKQAHLNPYQNSIQPGSIQAIQPSPINPTTTVSLANAMKILGIK